MLSTVDAQSRQPWRELHVHVLCWYGISSFWYRSCAANAKYEPGPVSLWHTCVLCSDEPSVPWFVLFSCTNFCFCAWQLPCFTGVCQGQYNILSVAGDELHPIFEDHRLFLVINVVLNLLQPFFRHYFSDCLYVRVLCQAAFTRSAKIVKLRGMLHKYASMACNTLCFSMPFPHAIVWQLATSEGASWLRMFKNKLWSAIARDRVWAGARGLRMLQQPVYARRLWLLHLSMTGDL